MLEFLQALVGFPTVLYTAPAALVLLYWMFVIVGAVDVDMVESAGGAADGAVDGAVDGVLDGAIDGAVDGAVEGAVDGAVDGAVEGVADGAAEGVADAAVDGATEGGFAEVFSWLKLRSAPATVVFSVFVFWGFVLTFVGDIYGGPLVGDVLPEWAFGTLVFAAATAFSLPLTSLSIRPLAPIFVHVDKRGHDALIGKTVVVRTTKVDARMGQALYSDGGAGLVLNVRCEDGAESLLRGDEALVVGHDKERDVYLIEPMRRLLEQQRTPAVPKDVAAKEGAAETTKDR